jgi:glycosyltransferase involved in cell wall biosynthesis
MRVGLVTQPADGALPPRQNSIGLIMYNTAVELSREIDVSLILKRSSQAPTTQGFPFQLEMIDTPWDDLLTQVAGRYPRWAGRLGLGEVADQYWNYARNVSGTLRRASCDVSHVMNYWQWCRTLRNETCPLVLEMQSEWLSQMDRDSVARQLQMADAVVGVSEHITRLFRQSFPDFRGLVATAYNGVDVDTFRPADGGAEAVEAQASERRVLFVGRLSPEKGVHTLIEAFARIAARFPDVTLELAGPRTILPHRLLVGVSSDPIVQRLNAFYDGTITSDYQAHLDQLVSKHALSNRLRFLGSLPHGDLVARYQSASLVVNPSFSESFGISIVEGMASAVPVIGTRIGGMQETIVDGETGLLLDANRPDDLALAMARILENPAEGRRMGLRGRERVVQTFSWAARARRLLDVYRKVIR